MRIITNLRKISEKIGFDVSDLLKPALFMDARVESSPFLVEGNGEKYLFSHDIERDAIKSNFDEDKDFETVYFGPYFTWAEKEKEASSDMISALKEIGASEFTVTDEVTLGRLEKIRDNFEVKVEEKDSNIEKYFCYETTPEEAIEKLETSKTIDQKEVEELLNRFFEKERKTKVMPYIEKTVDIFEVLDLMMEEQAVDKIIVSSPLNMQKIAGMERNKVKEKALLIYDGEKITLVSPYRQSVKPFTKTGTCEDLREFVNEQETVGIEEKDLSLSQWKEFGLDSYKKFTDTLGDWRDATAVNDLIYYIIASQAGRVAIENALNYASENISKNITENDVDKRFRQELKDFNAKLEVGVEIEKYFSLLIKGTRGYTPSIPTDAKIEKDMNTLKLDAGAIVYDGEIIRGTSDLCRTYTLTEKGQKTYEILGKGMLEYAIPAAKPGVKGKKVFQEAVKILKDNFDKFKNLKILPEDAKVDKYSRNAGHALGVQESATLDFTRNQEKKLEEGMIGCIEYQWGYDSHNIGVEDEFLVTDEGGANLTI